MTNLERETIILFNEAEDTAEVYTHNRKMIRQLDKLCEDLPKQCKEILKDEYSKTYEIPKDLVSIRRKPVFSAETKRKYREQGKALQKARAKA